MSVVKHVFVCKKNDCFGSISEDDASSEVGLFARSELTNIGHGMERGKQPPKSRTPGPGHYMYQTDVSATREGSRSVWGGCLAGGKLVNRVGGNTRCGCEGLGERSPSGRCPAGQQALRPDREVVRPR